MADNFEIHDLKAAGWAFQKINELETSIAEKKEYADDEMKRVQDWLKVETESDLSSIDYFSFLLTQYYGELRADNPKAKLSTPYGSVTSRKKQPEIIWDETATLEYLKANDPEMVKVTEKFNKADVKKLFSLVEVDNHLRLIDENGEVQDIANVTPQPDSITVKGAK